jgi:PAS domain-containing protein
VHDGGRPRRIDPELVRQQICCCLEDFSRVTCSLDGRITRMNRGAETMFGYARGALLRQSAKAMSSRHGGDEFALLQRNPSRINPGAVLAEQTPAVLAASFDHDGRTRSISGSIRIAIYPHDAPMAHDLRIKAGLAPYQSKRSGRNCFSLFHRRDGRSRPSAQPRPGGPAHAVAGNSYRFAYRPISMRPRARRSRWRR